LATTTLWPWCWRRASPRWKSPPPCLTPFPTRARRLARIPRTLKQLRILRTWKRTPPRRRSPLSLSCPRSPSPPPRRSTPTTCTPGATTTTACWARARPARMTPTACPIPPRPCGCLGWRTCAW